MLAPETRLISVDDHLVEHPEVWSSRLPGRFRDQGPRIVKVQAGFAGQQTTWREAWLYEDRVYETLALNAVAGRPFEEYTSEPIRYDDMLPGCYDPVERVRDMDRDGVQASLCFPTFPGFAGSTFLRGDDRELAHACVQAYNDFVVDEWCGTAPDRLIPMIITPFWDPPAAAAEIRRMAAKGAKAVSFPELPNRLGLPSFHTDFWDPIFQTAEEIDLPLCIHFGTSGSVPSPSPDSPEPVYFSLMACNSMFTVADLIFSKLLRRFPAVKIAMSEGGAGWVPYLTEKMDYTWDRQRFHYDVPQDLPPSEVFRRNFWACYIDDPHAIASRAQIGVDKLLWESDYPHADTTWPRSREIVAATFADIPDDETARIVERNARALFHFDADLAVSAPSPSVTGHP